MFEIKGGVVRLSVRELVEFIYRSGDIDSTKGIASDRMAMQAGSRIHKKIQKSMGASYTPEVPVRYEFTRNGYRLFLEGRIDGVIHQAEGVTIDEIKGVYANVGAMEEPVAVHKMQAMCYAHMYAQLKELQEISVTLTYANLDDETLRVFSYDFSKNTLGEWMEETLGKLDQWVLMAEEARQKRNLSIKTQEFPFPYRKGQRELVVSVYRTIARKKSLFIQAPTGVGKTISTIFPALKAIGEGHAEKLFYLTAKTITRTVAQETLEILEQQGVFLKRLTITAKEKICMRKAADGEKKVRCNPVECPYAKGHFDRVNEAVFDMVSNETCMNRSVIEQYAAKYRVCPFEMSLDASYWCDAVICDYNYVFDPNVYLKRFFAEGNSADYIFLIDEAHNLVDRGREMYSAAIVKEDIMEFRRLIKAYDARLGAALEKCNKAMLELKRQCEGAYMVLENAGSLAGYLDQVMDQMLRFSEVYKTFPEREQFNEFFFKVRDFLNIYERADDKYVVYAQITSDGNFAVRQYCVDPSTNLMSCMDKGISTILFSATLLPIAYYRALLRGNCEQDYAVYAHSAFEDEKRCVLLAEDVTTRYTGRGEAQYRRVVDYIVGMTSVKKGNYMVFFPSYGYMENVLSYMPVLENVRILTQTSVMSEEEKEDFLNAFQRQDGQGTLIGMCVMGGIFSEGIDLREDSLIGAVVVGTGLPQVCNSQEILKNYFDREMENGFAYAYMYPGFNKVLQSAGRVIRTVNDRGVILLLDERFLTGQYDGLFPEEWKGMKIVNIKNFQQEISTFWHKE
jgi:Rad3-related DNA helicase